MRWLLILLLRVAAFADWNSTKNDTTKTGTIDGSDGDMRTAYAYVDGKNEDGWVINVPAGTFTWTAAANMASTFVHSVTIQGVAPGTPTRGTNNTTIIKFNFTSSSQGMGFTGTSGKLTKVQYITWQIQGSNTLAAGLTAVDQTATTPDAVNAVWFENCMWENPNPVAMTWLGPNRVNSPAVWGLIDLCTFKTGAGDPGANAYNGVYVYTGNYGSSFALNTPGGMYLGSMTLGTVNTVCIEDCTFTNVITTVEGHPAIDSAYGPAWLARYNTFTNWVTVAHGSDTAFVSTFQVEYYNNTTTVSTQVDYGHYSRGGVLIAYSNSFNVTGSGGYNSGFKLTNDSSGGGYPYFEQIGRGAVAGTETTIGTYIYTNTYNNVTGQVTVNGAHDTEIQLNRDYFLAAPGVGKPLTSYTALQYPHPLRGSAATTTAGMTGTASISGNASLK